MKVEFKSKNEYERVQKALSIVTIVFLTLGVVGITIFCYWNDFINLIN